MYKRQSLNNTYMNDNNQIIATATAGGMGNMDIATPDHGYTPVMAEIGILQELDLERLPNYGNLFDFFKNVPGPNVDGTQYALPYTWGSIPLMYNPEFVTEKPTSWRDIMKPEYKGRVALTNDVISVIIPFTMTATSTKTPTRITKDELSAAIDMLIDVKTNYARTIASGYGELADLFASGEVIMAQSWEPVAAWAGDKGVKLDWTVPQEGTWTLIDCLALITDSPNEDAAYALLNHGLSAEAQAHVANVNTTGVTAEPAVPLLNDRAVVMTFEVKPGKTSEVQIRDIALGFVLHLAGQSLNDYGFAQPQKQGHWVYLPGTLRFNETTARDAALKKWTAWAAANPATASLPASKLACAVVRSAVAVSFAFAATFSSASRSTKRCLRGPRSSANRFA